jgi:hypothetical protein
MTEALKRYAILCLAVFAAMHLGHAQPKAAGTSWSFSGIGVTYEHLMNPGCFLNASIRAETGELFMNRSQSPGISASLSFNYILKSWKSRNGNMICAFAGPGISLGMADELKKGRGYFIGLKGRAGAECSFDRQVSITICINPVLGSHLTLEDDHLEMKLYRYGLLDAVMPEIGIKYMF